MRTYYQDHDIHITSDDIRVGCDRYLLKDLEQTWRHNGSLAKRRVLIGLGVLLLAVIARMVTGYLWWFRGLTRAVRQWLAAGPGVIALGAVGVLTVAGAGILAVELALLAVEDIREHSRYQELWTCVDGREVMLLRTNDSARFEKVRRALIRAIGDARDQR